MSDSKAAPAAARLATTWEFIEDMNGTEVGRRLYLPSAGGYLVEWNTFLSGQHVKRGVFVPRMADWLAGLEALVGRAISNSPLPNLLTTLQQQVTAMSGSQTKIQDAIDQLTADVGALDAQVTSEREAVDKAVAFIQGVPALIDAAIQEAQQNAALTPEQQSAFQAVRDHIKAEGDNLQASTTSLTGALPANPPPNQSPTPSPAPDPNTPTA